MNILPSSTGANVSDKILIPLSNSGWKNLPEPRCIVKTGMVL